MTRPLHTVNIRGFWRPSTVLFNTTRMKSGHPSRYRRGRVALAYIHMLRTYGGRRSRPRTRPRDPSQPPTRHGGWSRYNAHLWICPRTTPNHPQGQARSGTQDAMGVEGQGGRAFDALQGAVIITTRNPIQSDLDPTDVRPGVSGEPGGGWRRVWAMPHGGGGHSTRR